MEENICPIFGVIIQDNYLNLDRLQYNMWKSVSKGLGLDKVFPDTIKRLFL
jgi:hypothetical protein